MVFLQEDYLTGVKHYDQEEFHVAIDFLEQALSSYAVADVECRVLCEEPQRFEDYEYLRYKATLYEVIAGKLPHGRGPGHLRTPA